MVFIDEQRLHLGAEAEVWRGSWMGQSAIRKQRRNRRWRHPDLDDRLGRRRMIAEARLLVRLYRSGLNVPLLLDCDIFDQQLVMSHIQGKPLIEILNDTSVSDEAILDILKNTGQSIRMLHRQAVVHGDLSTNNIIITPEMKQCSLILGLLESNMKRNYSE